MAKTNQVPESILQQHIGAYLIRNQSYGVLEQSDITDTEHCIAEDRLRAFLEPRRRTR